MLWRLIGTTLSNYYQNGNVTGNWTLPPAGETGSVQNTNYTEGKRYLSVKTNTTDGSAVVEELLDYNVDDTRQQWESIGANNFGESV